ncbi:MBL fold metallo-hydrolase [Actinocorallia sp. A-T 12471]|uniref:MBL fold metallo-hydrolase n=1 Tax=Actinocorallia sp. A-T 12471 TaxID=3089813 RepID=UPI0029CE9104|nr:MBL fold metallo-hydrolase [Actinocorallia sp. A-T 12471]MDX6741344.1 MBL fold metallo-hydrolase [Actinocorallia sp. A-T 12471]
MEVTGVAQKQAWIDRVLPPVERVRPGLWSVPVPLPDNPLRYVLVYVLEGPSGVTLIDAGWDTPEAWDALNAGLKTAGYAMGDVKGVLVTHMHHDHWGLAARVREASGAWVGLHPEDARLIDERHTDPAGLVAAMMAQMAEHGVPADSAGTLADASTKMLAMTGHAMPDLMLEDGTAPPVEGWDLRTVWTPGHSPGHVCFHDVRGGLLLSGDHVLPRITPAIGLFPRASDDPLGAFFASLEKVRDLPVAEVLPAHEYRFAGLADRVGALLAHHGARLDEITAALADAAEPPTTWELAQELTWSRPWDEIQPFMRRTAMLETLAHLVVLEKAGKVARRGGAPVRWGAARVTAG